jgi:hypothetical protein
MTSVKTKLAVGLGVFLLAALSFLAVIVFGIVVDTALIGLIIFGLNAAIYWCGGWALIGFYKTLAAGLASALVLRVLKLLRKVLA